MSELSGQVALVTGSSRGIGAAIAKRFGAAGAAVAVHGRDVPALSHVVNAIRDQGGRAVAITGELTDFAAVEGIRAAVERELGPVDILVANAGGSYTPPAALEDIPEEGWHASIEGNLTTTFLTLKSFVPGMKTRRRGAIITISSAAGRRPHPRSPMPYVAAKAGVELMTQALASQVGPFGIRANCIAPETILTDRNRERIPGDQQITMAEQHPLLRLGSPEDVAEAALYLSSDRSSWITGVVLDVAGGAVMV
ncbi:SDR family NAD(P)-dependent oxidoreductase [Rhizobium jaguaris]|uniref:SDR family NAD(P)-dependent oxidoreductase n=1 Tax=Rhizobium jaguaris TaxID=1312183 RepID=UPI0039BF8CEB